MGPKQSSQEGEVETKINHPRFQNIRVVRNGFDGDRIEVKVAVANENEYNQWANQVKGLSFNTENFLLPESHTFEKEGFCGSTGFVTVHIHQCR